MNMNNKELKSDSIAGEVDVIDLEEEEEHSNRLRKMSAKEMLNKYDLEIKRVKDEQKRLAVKLQNLLDSREKAYENYILEKNQTMAQKNWTEENFEWTNKVNEVLNNTFKLNKFRQKQLAAINATLSKQDLILLMPTGGGKSLCYQLPALVTNGLTLVISPLVSLMEDQIMILKKLNVNAEMICSSSNKDAVKRIHDRLISGSNLKLLYVTPERMAKSKRFMSCLQKCYLRKGLDRIAIDEVHCCSQWGHDFRPDYKFLGILRSMFSEVPIIGLTATATTRILVDVQKMLDISGCLVLKASFNRPNLYYEVKIKPSNQAECISLLEDLLKNRYKDQSGIIYTTSIKDSIDLVANLRSRNLKLAAYHADLDSEIRSKIHEKWRSQYYQAVVATVAFGMGIDKPDVRFVIHHSLAKSMESFYQESGRAGRDGKPADCIVLYRLNDMFRLSAMVFSTNTGLANLYSMVDYCIDVNRCRRSIIASHFDEIWETCDCNNMCDHCKRPREARDLDITKYTSELYQIIALAASVDVRLTAIKLLDAWFQKGDKKLHLKILQPPAISRVMAENIIAYLFINDYLSEDFHFTAYSTISYIKRGQKSMLLTDKNHTIKMSIAGKTIQQPQHSEQMASDSEIKYSDENVNSESIRNKKRSRSHDNVNNKRNKT